jgi:hypothetical protein
LTEVAKRFGRFGEVITTFCGVIIGGRRGLAKARPRTFYENGIIWRA